MMKRVRVKVCGITTPQDAAAVVAAGADAIGFLFAKSPRRIEPEQALTIRRSLSPFVATVGVFVNERPERVLEVVAAVGLSTVQLHGDEPPEVVETIGRRVPTVKAIRVRDEESLGEVDAYPSACGFLLDAYVKGGARGGTGHVFNWDLLRSGAHRITERPWILAGGLHPENIERAVAACRPYAVDVSSGVESRPGVKDSTKVNDFMERVRRSSH